MTAPYLLDEHHKQLFPNVELALTEPDGLLAVGGDLSIERLVSAYQQGIFPWYSEGQPILWWSPNPRMVIEPKDIKVSRSLAKTMRKQLFNVTLDQNFREVITQCSKSRLEKGQQQNETWILDDMIEAYVLLHNAGFAHSVECWQGDKLVGGLYGIAIGKVFFGESMFSRVSDSSKIAFVSLAKQIGKWGFELIDCQVYSSHLESLGASMISRKEFITLMNQLTPLDLEINKWQFDDD